MTQKREEIAASDTWDVGALYPSLAAWDQEFKKWGSEKAWESALAFKGKLGESASTLLDFLILYLEITQNLSRLYTYAHLRFDEDLGCDPHKERYLSAVAKFHAFKETFAWMEPELLHLPQKELDALLHAPELAPYRIYLEKIVRFKPHTLSAREEALLAGSAQPLGAMHRAFGAFNNADLKFSPALDSEGKAQEVTHGKYLTYLRSPDRVLRKNSYASVHESYAANENMLAELIQGEVQKHAFFAKARGFSSCLEAALFPHQVEPFVYRNLIGTVRGKLGALHRYMKLRKKILGVEELHMYDLHVPLLSGVDFSLPYAEAEAITIRALAPLGEEYQKELAAGLGPKRWVDRYENDKKRSGAYSSGCYGAHPYILMNYQGTFSDLTTLAHEAGHSMHSFFSWKNQPYQDADYPIFVAEVASTFNEALVFDLLLKETEDKKRRAYLLNQEIEDIRNTLFRQTMFAEFELLLHEWVEKGAPITPALLKSEYRKLNLAYFGPEVVIDPETDIEWARIPHFYYDFYVYQYATGISAAHALVEVVKKEGSQRYLKFLSSGGSKYPMTLLQEAGVDMNKEEAILGIIGKFEWLMEELERLC